MVGVSLISTSSVATFSSPLSPPQVIELTPWDLSLLPISSIQKGLLFLKPNLSESFQPLVDHLRTSLSRTLDHFPLLAGRFRLLEHDHGKSSFSVVCNNAGAEFVHAAAENVTVSDIVDPLYVPRIVYSFFPLNGAFNYEATTKPLLAVQVTELVDGFFIGITMNHAVADGHSFWMFFNSWSEISRSGTDKISITPSFDRLLPDDSHCKFPLIIPYHPVINPSAVEMDFPAMEERFFHFSKEKISSLKTRANAEATNAGVTISSLQALLAHFWRCLVRCQGIRNDQLVKFGVTIGVRQRLRPPLAEGYFGNAIQLTVASAEKGQLLGSGLGWAAGEISRSIAPYTNEEVQNYTKCWLENPQVMYPNTKWDESKTMISSSPRFNVYGNDFGWGRPVAVRSGASNKGYSKVTLFPGTEEGSIDIEAYLLPAMLSAMGHDEEFMEAVAVPAKSKVV